MAQTALLVDCHKIISRYILIIQIGYNNVENYLKIGIIMKKLHNKKQNYYSKIYYNMKTQAIKIQFLILNRIFKVV